MGYGEWIVKYGFLIYRIWEVGVWISPWVLEQAMLWVEYLLCAFVALRCTFIEGRGMTKERIEI